MAVLKLLFFGIDIADRFKERGSAYLVIEKNPKSLQDEKHYVLGDAADIRTLQRAWIEKAPAALITSTTTPRTFRGAKIRAGLSGTSR